MTVAELAQDTEAPTLPREIAPGIVWFGCCLEVHEGKRILHSHNSCYLMSGSTATVLIDTAMPYGWRRLRKELTTVLAGRPLDYVFPTHPEAPHMGNTGPLLAMYPNLKIVGDLRNYHLYYPHAQDRFQPMQVGDRLDLGGRTLVMTEAAIHDIPNSLWGYDPDEQVLFVSDAYPYTHDHEAGQCGLTSEELPEPIRPEDTSVVIGRALNWARVVEPDLVIDHLRAFLKRYPAKVIAPAHGGVITNPVEITRVFEAGLRSARQ